jgi:hypothetical protein
MLKEAFLRASFVVNYWCPANAMCQQGRSNFRDFHLGVNGNDVSRHDICCVHVSILSLHGTRCSGGGTCKTVAV